MELNGIISFAVKYREAIKTALTKNEKESIKEFMRVFGERQMQDFMQNNFDEIIEFIFLDNHKKYKCDNSHLVKLSAVRLLDYVIEYIGNMTALKVQLGKMEKEEELINTNLFFYVLPFFRAKPYLPEDVSC